MTPQKVDQGVFARLNNSVKEDTKNLAAMQAKGLLDALGAISFFSMPRVFSISSL